MAPCLWCGRPQVRTVTHQCATMSSGQDVRPWTWQEQSREPIPQDQIGDAWILARPPGDWVRSEMRARGWEVSILPKALGRSQEWINHMLRGAIALTHRDCWCLERVLQIRETTWWVWERMFQADQRKARLTIRY